MAGFADSSALASQLRRMTVDDQGNLHTIRLALREPMNLALKSLGRVPLETPSQPKFSLVLTPFFRLSGVTGMINPFGLETIVFPDLLPFERPFVLAHEWGHLSGHADEAEASAVGWLACMKGDAVLGYSASLYLVMETARAMPDDVREKAMARLDAGVRADIDAIANRMQAQNPAVQQTTREGVRQLPESEPCDGRHGELRASADLDSVAAVSRRPLQLHSQPLNPAG